MNVCEKCGCELQPGMRFCDHCGHRLEDPTRLCGNCGRPLRVDAQFCDQCGSPAQAVSTSQTTQAPRPPPIVTYVRPPRILTENHERMLEAERQCFENQGYGDEVPAEPPRNGRRPDPHLTPAREHYRPERPRQPRQDAAYSHRGPVSVFGIILACLLIVMAFMPFTAIKTCETSSSLATECYQYGENSTTSLSLSSFTPFQNIFCCATCTHKDITFYGLLPAWLAVIGAVIMLAAFTVSMILQRGRIPKAVVCMIVGICALVATLIIQEDPLAYALPLMPVHVYSNYLVLSVKSNIAYEILLAISISIFLIGLLELGQRPRRLFDANLFTRALPKQQIYPGTGREEPAREEWSDVAWPKISPPHVKWPRIQLQRPHPYEAPSEPRRREPKSTPPKSPEPKPQPEYDRSEPEIESEPEVEPETEATKHEAPPVEPPSEEQSAEAESTEPHKTEEPSPEPQTLICSKCGRQLREGARFCSKCRTPVINETSPDTSADERQEPPEAPAEQHEQEEETASDEKIKSSLSEKLTDILTHFAHGPITSERELRTEGRTGSEGPEIISTYGFKRWRLAGFKYDNPYLNWGFLILGIIMFLYGITAGILNQCQGPMCPL